MCFCRNARSKRLLEPGDWALEICSNLNASTYINPHGGYKIFEEEKFKQRNIKLSFLKPDLKTYDQSFEGFQPSLSILDMMMFLNKSEIVNRIENDYKLLSKNELVDMESK